MQCLEVGTLKCFVQNAGMQHSNRPTFVPACKPYTASTKRIKLRSFFIDSIRIWSNLWRKVRSFFWEINNLTPIFLAGSKKYITFALAFSKWRFRLAARTHASHAWNTGSIPVGATTRISETPYLSAFQRFFLTLEQVFGIPRWVVVPEGEGSEYRVGLHLRREGLRILLPELVSGYGLMHRREVRLPFVFWGVGKKSCRRCWFRKIITNFTAKIL